MAARHKKPAKAAPFVGAHRLALFAVLVVGANGVGASTDNAPAAAERSVASAPATTHQRPAADRAQVSRSIARKQLESKSSGSFQDAEAPEAKLEKLTKRFATTDVNVWSDPDEDSDLVTVLSTGNKVQATGVTDGPWAEILRDGTYRWVHADYLAKDDPSADNSSDGDSTSGDEAGDEGGSDEGGGDEGGSGGVSAAPCDSGSAVEEGLTPNAVRVHRAVCAEFPEITTYGGLRADSGEHGSGRALDIMVSDSAVGDQIAEWVRANASELGASEVIWSQQIWTVQRSSEGWRSMSDRGSTTANHYDHVHVTVYG